MAEETVYIPNFSYPFKDIKDEDNCYTTLSATTGGNYLFSAQGLWHGGMHFDKSFDKEIKAIADGELVAYRLNENYLQNEGEKVDEGLYSTGFFLLKHKLVYPKDNPLAFFSLYMHTAKKSEYEFSTHKVVGTNRFLRKGVSYADTDKLEELAEGTKITVDPSQTQEEKDKHRYRVLYVGETKRTDGATIHATNIQALDNAVKLKTLTHESKADSSIQFPTQKIEVKAGETIGLKGVYAAAKQKKEELTHIEVFAGDDFKSFVEKAKEKYHQDTTEDKPAPTKIKIPKDIKEYKKEKIYVVESSAGYTNLRKAYKKGDAGYDTLKVANQGVKLTIDKTSLLHNRYHVLKIEDTDVTAQNWTVHKGYIKESFKYVEDSTTQPNDEIVKITDIQKESSDDKEYLLYNDKVFLYKDCKEQHPVTFEWAEIIEVKSNDFVSIYDDIEKLFVKEMQRDLKLSKAYEELFEKIDTNSDHKLEPQEVSNASKDKVVKETTSKFVVQHSSEWDEEVNMAQVVIDIIEKLKDKLTDVETSQKHYKAEQARIEKLAFFKKCKSIAGFPRDHLVYHMNPIGLVAEFGQGDDCITNWTKGFHRKIDGQNIYSEYISQASKKYDIPCKILKSLIAQESGFDPKAHNNVGYAGLTQVGKTEWTSKSGVHGSIGTTTKTNGQYIYDMKNDERFDPKKSIFGGAKILDRKRKSIDHLIADVAKYTDEEKWKFYLAAYNGGEGVVSQAYEDLGKQNAQWEDLVKETAWTDATFKTARDKIDKYYKKHGYTLRTDVQWTSIKNTTKYSPLLVSLLYQTWGGKAKYDEVSGYVENIIARKNQ